MKEHYTESIFTLHGTNRNRVRSIISGALLNLPIALSLWYESQKYLLVTLMVFNLHRKEVIHIKCCYIFFGVRNASNPSRIGKKYQQIQAELS